MEQEHDQIGFNPTDFCFEWTAPTSPDDTFGWYRFDHELAHSKARAARDDKYRELKALGYKPHRSVLKRQLITKGGIGTCHPQVEFLVDVYLLSW